MNAGKALVTSDGVRIAYRQAGPAGGPVVVLCHGICASGRQFEADAGCFAAAGYCVLVPDLRAHGASGAPPTGSGDFTIARLAADMFAMLDDAGAERVHWLGNSLGGIVGLAMLREAPGRFASFATFGTAYRLNLPRAAARLLPLLYKAIGPRRLGRVTAAMTTRDPAARLLIAEMIASFDPGPGERLAAELCSYDLIDAAQQFARPVLLIRGGRDHAVNRALGRTFAAMADHPDFQRIDFRTAGHCANLDVPAALHAALDAFWRRAGARPAPTAAVLPAA